MSVPFNPAAQQFDPYAAASAAAPAPAPQATAPQQALPQGLAMFGCAAADTVQFGADAADEAADSGSEGAEESGEKGFVGRFVDALKEYFSGSKLAAPFKLLFLPIKLPFLLFGATKGAKAEAEAE